MISLLGVTKGGKNDLQSATTVGVISGITADLVRVAGFHIVEIIAA